MVSRFLPMSLAILAMAVVLGFLMKQDDVWQRTDRARDYYGREYIPDGSPIERPHTTGGEHYFDTRRLELAAIEGLKLEVGRLGALLDDLSEQARWYQEGFPELLEAESGKAVSGDEVVVATFRALRDKEHMTPASVAALQGSLRSVGGGLQEITRVRRDEEGIRESLSGIERTAREALRELRETRETALGLVGGGTTTTPSAGTLLEAIQASEAKVARMRAEAIAAALRETEEKHQEELAKAELEKAKARQEIELANEKAQVESLQAEASEAKLRAMAADPAVQAKFRPFLASGTARAYPTTMVDRPELYYREAGPLGYTEIRDARLLIDYERFLKFATNTLVSPKKNYHRNDRPSWSWPESGAAQEECRERWELFKKLAPYWRDSGALRP